VFLVARLIRLGWVTDYFSRAVLIGYLHGVAVVLVIGQLGKLFGLTPEWARAPSSRACSPPWSSPSCWCS
jgi:MFS superfamily sulfate permease-like transporter